jgi:hypothetical protein
MKFLKLDSSAKSLIALCLGAVVALSLLGYRYIGRETDFGDAAALGAQTVSLFASRGSYPIHCQPGGEFENCLRGIEFRHRSDHIIWLGNSQLHAINHYSEGELNAPAMLANRIERNGADLVTFSFGNANLQEHYVIYEYLRTRVNFRQLILPVVFDDFREDGLRDEVAVFLKGEALKLRLAESASGASLLAKAAHADGVASSKGRITPQEYVEAALERGLESCFRLWQARDEMRGDIFISLYRLRNTVFGITPNTKRKVVLHPYAANMSALDALLKSAAQSGIAVVMYVAPINVNNGERPYEETEYRRFKVEVEVLARKYGVTYRNFEDLVPEPLWGRKDSTMAGGAAEIDYMHFTSAGHALLADHVAPLLAGAGREKKQQ